MQAVRKRGFYGGGRILIKVTALPFVIPSAAEGSAVCPGSRTKISVPLVLPQNRHPERSAPQIDRVTQRLWRGVEEPVLSVAEGTSAVLIFTLTVRSFQPPNPHDLAQPWGCRTITVHENMYL